MPLFFGLVIEGPPDLGACGTYVLNHIKTGKKYIGSTKDIIARLRCHKKNLTKGKAQKGLQELYDISPCFYVFFKQLGVGVSGFSETRQLAYDYEQQLVDYYLPQNLVVNACPDVRSPRNPMGSSKKAREKFSVTMKIKWTEDPAFREKETKKLRELRNTEQARQRQSEISKQKWSDEKFRSKQETIRSSNEFREKLSASHFELWKNPEYREKMIQQRNDPEYKDKFLDAMTDRSLPVIVDGVRFRSASEAARKLKLSHKVVLTRCRSKRFDNYSLIE